jgi:hypothetical protein
LGGKGLSSPISGLRGSSTNLASQSRAHVANCKYAGQLAAFGVVRTFDPRRTGGSVQKFCCTAHKQQFWIAARRWTMRAIDAVDCLKASHTSVHAA